MFYSFLFRINPPPKYSYANRTFQMSQDFLFPLVYFFLPLCILKKVIMKNKGT